MERWPRVGAIFLLALALAGLGAACASKQSAAQTPDAGRRANTGSSAGSGGQTRAGSAGAAAVDGGGNAGSAALGHDAGRAGAGGAADPSAARPGAGGSGHAGSSGSGGGAGRSDGGGVNAGSGDASGVSAGSGDASGVSAVAAIDFLASIGVCTHVGQGVDAPAASATAIAYAGIRNLRDDGNPAHVTDWIAMHASSDVRVCLLTNRDVAATIDMAKQLKAAGALLAVEGPNEPNNFPVTYQSQTSSYDTTFAPVAALQRDLYAAVHAEPALAGIPVFHSSEAGGSEPDNVGLQFLTIPTGAGIAMPDGTHYADYANVHNYACGHSNQLVDNLAWKASDATLNGDWDGMYVEYGHTWHKGFAGYSDSELSTLPKVTTETGWLTMGNGAITEEQQAKVLLDLYLAAYARGFSYTFVYMLRDDPGQGYWGLFDTSYNPKKSGEYLHNLTTLLADTSAGTPGKLDFMLASEPETVHHLLLQKHDGTFELVIWDERFAGGSDDVTLDLGRTRAMVKVYDPTIGTDPTVTKTDVSSIALTLSDHPLVIEL